LNEPEPRAEGFQRSGPKTATRKARRVSQRKELAIVTLGAVAAITGVGGLLDANPPSGASVDTAYQTSTFGEPEPAQSNGETPSEATTTESEPATEQKQEPVQQEPAPAPSWSAPASQQEPPAAESRGS
jgi:cytoskeletal protein RodZ